MESPRHLTLAYQVIQKDRRYHKADPADTQHPLRRQTLEIDEHFPKISRETLCRVIFAEVFEFGLNRFAKVPISSGLGKGTSFFDFILMLLSSFLFFYSFLIERQVLDFSLCGRYGLDCQFFAKKLVDKIVAEIENDHFILINRKDCRQLDYLFTVARFLSHSILLSNEASIPSFDATCEGADPLILLAF